MSKFYDIKSQRYVSESPYIHSSGEINEQVDQIISNRASHRDQLDAARRRLNELESAISNFNSVRQNVFGSLESVRDFFKGDATDKSEAFWEKLQNVNSTYLNDLAAQCRAVAAEIRNAGTRFSRKYISIAVVGESRQGKSTLIQKITGLSEAAVPTSEGDICTAARSRIINSREQHARITFYSKDEFFHEIIAPYFVRAGVIRQEDCVTINDFAFAQELFARIAAAPDVYIQRLREYLDPVRRASYAHYLGEDALELEDFSQLREYMAQRDEINNAFPSYKYYAVKDIEIFTPFANAGNATKLMIFDTIGVSEPTLGVKDQMYSTISEEADFVLYVSRLSNNSSKWIRPENVALYYNMLKQLKGVPAYRWLFWVLNHEDENAYPETLGGLEGVFEENFAHIYDNINAQAGGDITIYMPAGVLCVDCRNPNDVENNLVAPLISHLAVNLSKIDEALTENVNSHLRELEAGLRKIQPVMDGLKLQMQTTVATRNWLKERARTEAINSLTERLPELLDSICPEHLIDEWREEVRLVIQNLDEAIPNVEAIRNIRANNQNNALMTINSTYQRTRKSLEGVFSGAQFQFDDMIDAVKRGMVKLFLQCAKIEGFLGQPLDYESPQLIPTLNNILFGEYGTVCEVLSSAFSDLDRFDVAQGNLLTNWISSKSASLDTNLGNGNIPQYWKDLGLENAIITKLQSLIGDIRIKLNADVENLESPIQQIRNKVFSFKNTISQVGGEYTVAWQTLFEEYIEKIYPDEFKDIQLYNLRVKAWNDSLDRLTDSQVIQSITF